MRLISILSLFLALLSSAPSFADDHGVDRAGVVEACSRFYNPSDTLNACFRAEAPDVVTECQRFYNPSDSLN
ncbi:MAG: hypothetical protein ACXVCK_21575, partial [Bdellovibrionota bacterium]